MNEPCRVSLVQAEPFAVLVHPSTGSDAPNAGSLAGSDHLGLSYLSAALTVHGIDSTIFDLQREPSLESDLLSLVRERRPPFIGLSPTSKSFHAAWRLSRKFRVLSPNSAIAMGGHLATACGDALFAAAPEVDIVVRGHGEDLIASLVESAARRAVPTHPRIGLNPRSSLTPVSRLRSLTGATSWTALLPARRGSDEFYATNGARVISSVGCQFRCSFCTTPQFYDSKVTHRHPEHVAEEVAYLAGSKSVRKVWFNDDLFLTAAPKSRRRAIEIAQRISEVAPGTRLRIMARSDSFKNAPDLLDTLASLGLDTVFIGLEAGDNAALRRLRKDTDVDKNREIASILNEKSIILQPGFIMFAPGNDPSTLLENAKFLQDIGELYRFFPLTRTVSILPGTSLWASTSGDKAWDRPRSTIFERYPQFADPAVRTLSMAYERLEMELADIDTKLYRARGLRGITFDQRRALGLLIENIFVESVKYANSGKTTDWIIDHVRSRSEEVCELASAMSIPGFFLGKDYKSIRPRNIRAT